MPGGIAGAARQHQVPPPPATPQSCNPPPVLCRNGRISHGYSQISSTMAVTMWQSIDAALRPHRQQGGPLFLRTACITRVLSASCRPVDPRIS
jgi:hypothetical protein